MTSKRHGLLLPAIQLATISTTAFLSGFITSFSWYGIQTLQPAPAEFLVRQWKIMYSIGAQTAPTIAIACASGFAYLSYNARHTASFSHFSPSLLYAMAAFIVPLIAPYTVLVMRPRANDELMEMAAKAESGEKGESVGSDARIEGLLDSWKSMNFVRAGLVAMGVVLGSAGALL